MHTIVKRITFKIIETTVIGVSSSILINNIYDNIEKAAKRTKKSKMRKRATL